MELARAEFEDFGPADEKFFRAVAEGEVAEYREGDEDKDSPANADKWGEERVLKADRIGWVCTDKDAREEVTHRGIEVKGARIDGNVDLAFRKVPFDLFFESCHFGGIITLLHSVVPGLYLSGSQTKYIEAEGLSVKNNVFLKNGFRSDGKINLRTSRIGGTLDCSGSSFENNDGEAISAYAMKVDGDVVFTKGFYAKGFGSEGAVNIRASRIGGVLNCSGGSFENSDGVSINAYGMKVGGDVLFKNGFKSDGVVILIDAEIKGGLECSKCKFTNPNPDKESINALRMRVVGNVFLQNCFMARGEVRLNQANIGQDLGCTACRFESKNGPSLNAEGIRVGGSVFCRNNFQAIGSVNFIISRVHVGFQWRNVLTPDKTSLDLRLAEIGSIWVAPNSWPKKGNLRLNGLVYSDIPGDAHQDAATLISFLNLQPSDKYYPQPYEQMAKVLKASGREEDAKKILIEKNKIRLERGELNLISKVWLWLLGALIGYGYRPWKAGVYAMIVIVFGALLFVEADRKCIMTDCGEEKTNQTFSAFFYSLDKFVPFLDLDQAKHWRPLLQKNRPNKRDEFGDRRIPGEYVYYYQFAHVILGWLLTTIFIVGLTGAIRQ